MPYESAADLRYISGLDALPFSGPDLWSDAPSAKLDAAETAEAKLEADVNDGHHLTPSETEAIHGKAAAAYASYLLFIGPEHPEDARSGRTYGGAGEDIMEFATELHDVYRSLRSSIETADGDESSDDADFTLSG